MRKPQKQEALTDPSKNDGVSREAWIAALGQGLPQGDDDPLALTVMELADLLGVSRNTATSRIGKLVKDGKARATHKRLLRGDGRSMIARAYRLNP